MRQWYMVTVIGMDRAGIVAALAQALFKGGANLGEASMSRLGGNFTIMLMVETGLARAQLEHSLAPVAHEMGLRIHVDPIEGRLHAHREPNLRVTVHGADRPGIVAQITGILAALGFEIHDLYSDVGGSPDRPIYIMMLEGRLTASLDVLEQALGPLRAGGIEVRATPIDTMVG